MMLKMLLLLLSFRLLQGIPGLLASRPSHGYLEEMGSLRFSQPSHASLLQMAREVPLSSDFDPLAFEMPGLQNDDHTPDASRVELQASSLPSPPPGREERSPPLSLLPPPPRRCVRLQESCLGHMKLPCCDPCATCYCRFFNANCFCKRLSSSAFPCGRN